MCELDQQSRAHMTLGVGKKLDFLVFLMTSVIFAFVLSMHFYELLSLSLLHCT